MNGQSKKLNKISLTGFILSFITPVSHVIVFFYVMNNPESLFSAFLLWGLAGLCVSQIAHSIAEIGIILCAVKKQRGIAFSVVGMVISKFAMIYACIIVLSLIFHESPPTPVQGY